MALPPGFLEDLRTRVTLSAVVGRKVTWDMRKSNQGRGDWWAPCPTSEKTRGASMGAPCSFFMLPACDDFAASDQGAR